MTRFRPILWVLFSFISSSYIVSCSDNGEPEPTADSDSTEVDAALAEMGPVAETYADLVYANYQDALTATESLDEAIDEFLGDPSSESLNDARLAWLAAREPYLQTEAFRFYNGPIDNPESGPEGQINAWPLDENYIDATVDSPDSGIINDTEVELSSALLISLNAQGGETNIATGYHAIEFLLWGQDLSADGPGNRSFTDYTTAPNFERRAEYLRLVSALLVENLGSLVDAWAPKSENYRADFSASNGKEQLTNILTGLIILSGFETGGERIQPALDSQDQEDEHSCFSDNTHRDFIQDVRGIENVYLGRYAGLSASRDVEGASIFELVSKVDEDLATLLKERMATSLTLAEAMEVPFDNEISSGNPDGNARVQALLDSLRAQEKLLEEVFHSFKLAVPVAQ